MRPRYLATREGAKRRANERPRLFTTSSTVIRMTSEEGARRGFSDCWNRSERIATNFDLKQRYFIESCAIDVGFVVFVAVAVVVYA